MQQLLTTDTVTKTSIDYAQLSLIELTGLIADSSDRKALSELHENRAFFRHKDSRPLLMVDFLVRLRQQPASRQWCNNNQMALEQAFDLTLSKFLNIPKNNGASGYKAETFGPDCRYYYSAFNNRFLAEISSKGLDDELEIEFMAAKLLQNFVFRHFYLSCLECRRREQKLVRKVHHQFDGQNLNLWIPAQMTTKMFEKWFNENIAAQKSCKFSQQDIQEIVDNSLLTRKIIPLEDIQDCQGLNAEYRDFSSALRERISSNGLAGTIADEKADNIEDQRPAIRSLGTTRLKKLIQMIFESLAGTGSDYRNILSEFGLSKATFSRFAGSRWNNNGSSFIPDLWKNTAHVLANHPDFTEVVKEAGLWNKVRLAAGTERIY
ncbi:MAG: hypothetical protein ABIG61_07750 [Planctomycetota bacterium]